MYFYDRNIWTDRKQWAKVMNGGDNWHNKISVNKTFVKSKKLLIDNVQQSRIRIYKDFKCS